MIVLSFFGGDACSGAQLCLCPLRLEQTERAFRCFRPVLQTSAFQHFQEQLYIERSARLREMREAA